MEGVRDTGHLYRIVPPGRQEGWPGGTILEWIKLTGQARGTPRRSRFLVALSLLAALQAAPPVCAWGRLGHRLTARIAERCAPRDTNG
jgi:hypothetical protein